MGRPLGYSRSRKLPALKLLQKIFKSASTTAQRPFGTVAVRNFWENGCRRFNAFSRS